MTFDEKQPDLTVMFELTEGRADGGAKTVSSGYRPHYRVRDDYWTTAFHTFVDMDQVTTGQRALAHVWLLSPEAYPESIWPGRVLSVSEGSRVVGAAEVLTVNNPLLLGEQAV